MMNKQVTDERIIQEARKQNSVGFSFLYYGLLLVLLYRQFILQEPFSKYWDLAMLFFGVTFILATKRISSGIFTNKIHYKSNIVSSVMATVVFTIINFYWIGNNSAARLITIGLLFFFVFYGITLLFQYFSKKKNDDMLKED